MTSFERQKGFTYLTALLLLAAVGTSLAAFGELWSRARQREKEAELIWIGNQFKQAIGNYYESSPGAVKRYPEKLEDLLDDRRYLTIRRHLRTLYLDPMTARPNWVVVPAPAGGIMGVHSASKEHSVRTFHDAARYSEWWFLYDPPTPLSGELTRK